MDSKQKTLEDQNDELYSATEYKKSQFTFSKEQLADLQPLINAIQTVQTFITLGQIASNAIDNYVLSKVLPSLGVKQSSDVKLLYEIEKNRIVTYEPRFWCSKCNQKRAEYKYEDKTYCPTCIEELKQAMKTTPITAEKVEEPKKKNK